MRSRPLARRRIEAAHPRGLGHQPSRVDAQVLKLADELRTVGITTAILTDAGAPIKTRYSSRGFRWSSRQRVAVVIRGALPHHAV